MRLTSRVHVATSRARNFYVEAKFMIFLCAFGKSRSRTERQLTQPINITTNFQLINLTIPRSAVEVKRERKTWKYRDNVVRAV
jgi:hypothetical protein